MFGTTKVLAESLGHTLRENRQLTLRVKELEAAAACKPLTAERFDPLRKDEMLTAFAVGDDEPLLQGVVHVLHAMEIERGDNASESGISAEVSKGYAMAQGALKEAGEEILRWVDDANGAKRGDPAV